MDKNSATIVGVSGGADSLFCLLFLLFGEQVWKAASKSELLNSPRSSQDIIAFNAAYEGRSQEAIDDVEFLTEVCREIGVPFLHEYFSVSPENRIGNDEADLREWRYERMSELAREKNAASVAVGHNRDDVAESLILMSLRGSGPRGLGSLQEVVDLSDGLKLIRPILGLSRILIRDRLQELGFQWREDSWNADGKVRRNVIRHQVFPVLEKLEVSASNLMAQSARLCREEHDLLCRLVREKYGDLISFRDDDGLLFECKALEEIDQSIFRIFLRALIEETNSSSMPGIEELDTLYGHLQRNHRHDMTLDWRNGTQVLLTNNWLFLGWNKTGFPEKLKAAMIAAGWYVFETDDENWIQELAPVPPFSKEADSEYAVFDAELKDRAVYRLLEPDSLMTLENDRKQSVRELLAAKKIPGLLRPHVHGFIDQETNQVLWIPGVRRSALGFVSEDAVNCLKIYRDSKVSDE